MAIPAIYRWKASHFCRDCIVTALTTEEPWRLWQVRGNEPLYKPDNDEVEEQLDSIAELFRIDRTLPEDVINNDFPKRVYEIPEPPDFCGGCLHWFSLPSDVRDFQEGEGDDGE